MDPSVNIVRLDLDVAGTVESYRKLLWRLVVPHEGLVTADTGRIHYSYPFDENGEPAFEGAAFVAGQQENQFIPSVCAAPAA